MLSVLSDSKLPKKLWPEILKTVVYVKNRSPVSVPGSKIPFEMLYGRKPDLSELRIPGCIAYAIIPAEKRSKMDMHASRARYLGPEASNQHRLYEESSGRVIFARDVIFDEEAKIIEVPRTEREGFPLEEPHEGAELPQIPADTHVSGGESAAVNDHESREIGVCDSPDQGGSEPRVSASTETGTAQEAVEPIARIDEQASEPTESTPSQLSENPWSADLIGLRRSGRERLPSRKLREALELSGLRGEIAHALLAVRDGALNIPQTYEEALKCSDGPKWLSAIQSEYNSLIENGTWDLIPRSQVPDGHRVIKGKWVFDIKGDGRYKARWVVKGFTQRPGFDYDETYAAVTRSSSWRMLLAQAGSKGLKIRQADVSTAFLYGPIDHEIYAEQPQGYEHEGMVCRLNKSLYGLKQASRIWWELLTKKLKEMGFRQLTTDPCVYTNGEVIIDTHVDDFLLISADDFKIDQILKILSESFKIKDLGKVSRFLGVDIKYDEQRRTLTLNQARYIDDILQRFGMKDSKPKSTPMLPGERLDNDVAGEYLDAEGQERYQAAVGALNFLSCMTRPDIAFTVSILAKFTQKPQQQHHLVLQRTLRYLKATRTLGITYGLNRQFQGELMPMDKLYGFTDADHGGTVVQDESRSTGGYVFMFANGPVSWASKRQTTTAISSTEAEYIGQFEAMKEMEYLQMFLDDLEGKPYAEPGEISKSAPVTIFADNTAAIKYASTPGMKARSKHLRITLHWQRQVISEGRVKLYQIPSKDMAADGLTKPLTRTGHNGMLQALHMVDMALDNKE
jgi:hypothetical protein